MITICDGNLKQLGNIKNVIAASRTEQINGENTLDFSVILDDKIKWMLNQDSILLLNGQYFDVKVFTKSLTEEGIYQLDIEAEHVSYRLNDPAFNVEFFTEYGTSAEIGPKILAGTGFIFTGSEFLGTVTYSAQEAMSRRQVLMEFAQYIHAEILFDNWNIGFVQHLGSYTPKIIVKDRDVTVLSSTVNKRELKNGLPKVTYSCTPVNTPLSNFELGDNITLRQLDLGINQDLRAVSITYNPYDPSETSFVFSDQIGDLSSSLYDIVTDQVVKDAKYNGIRIGPEFGFEAVRNDKRARAYFRSDGMVFQSGDGNLENPEWKDRLYYEYDAEEDETYLVFDGKFTAEVIEALAALVTNNLYAKRGYISELTVDSLETSNKLQRYLSEDTSNMYFIRIREQVLQFITAVYAEDEEQAKSRDGEDLYWLDDSFEVTTTTVTDYPAMVYTYTEVIKMEQSFDYDSSLEEYVPRINLGAGNGVDTKGTGAIYRGDKGLYIDYYNSQDGELRQILLNDDGVILTPELNLYGEKGNVAEITVDRLDGSTKVQRYLDGDESELNYIKIIDQYINFMTATCTGGSEQATSRDGDLLYWVDEEHTSTTLKDVDYEGNANEPVMQYTYNEMMKMEMAFLWADDLEEYIPVITMGAGTGVDDNAKGRIHKRTDGLYLTYFHSEDGGDKLREIALTDDGLIFTPPLEGNSAIKSTTLSIPINTTGEFQTEEWTHGFNSAQTLIQFLVTAKDYDGVKLRDLRVEETSPTKCRIVGYAELI